MSRTKLSIAMALVASAALSVSLTGCFGDEETANPVTTPAAVVTDSFKVVLSSATVGAQDAPTGSFISLRSATPTVYNTKGLEGAGVQASIDLIFFSDTNGIASFMSPKEALADSLLYSNTGWTSVDTRILKVGTAPVTVSEAKALSITGSIAAVPPAGGNYVVKLTDATYAVIKVAASTGEGIEAQATISILK